MKKIWWTVIFTVFFGCKKNQPDSEVAGESQLQSQSSATYYLEADSADFEPCADNVKQMVTNKKIIVEGGECYTIRLPEKFDEIDSEKPMAVYIIDSYPDAGDSNFSSKSLNTESALDLIRKAQKNKPAFQLLSTRSQRIRCRAAAGLAAFAPSLIIYSTAAAVTMATAGTGIVAAGAAAGVSAATTAQGVELVTVAGGLTATVFTGKAIYDAAYKSCMRHYN
ncbi:MAG: hypothetical protein HQK54_06255 [Oligoflexales bacterium]|nr:hypothetical protein [Oligoflexales bacterium]